MLIKESVDRLFIELLDEAAIAAEKKPA